jgi:hypothetical protein
MMKVSFGKGVGWLMKRVISHRWHRFAQMFENKDDGWCFVFRVSWMKRLISRRSHRFAQMFENKDGRWCFVFRG